ncbi:hypothetical protein [Ferrimonas balearica]|nr:hypothetical protein [Ferrimonas balearica]MBY5992714.1 hypothetical protein [Ferrimonas balearica]
MKWVKHWWQRYCDFLDSLGLTPENKRCCVPLSEEAQKALKRGDRPD